MKLNYVLDYKDKSISLSIDRELAISISDLLNKIIKEKIEKSDSIEELEETQKLLHSYIELKKVIIVTEEK